MKGLIEISGMFENYPDVLNVTDIQKMLGIGKNTAYRLIKENKIQNIKIGKTYKIPKYCVIEFLANKDCTNPV
ncbi:MAG TPA: DNA-binding protein [Clostridiales bacterium]|nr:helix-turn-helix domain-containing protein [Lachnospiraceae bacterium]HAQ40803.1 DNA-binding protein [Clostridiales bacterium]